MTEQNTQNSEVQTEVQTPPAEVQTQEKSPEALAREAELKDISDLLGMGEETPKTEEEKEAEAKAEAAKDPEGKAKTEGEVKEQKTAPVLPPVKEEVKPEAKPQAEGELKDLLKQVIAEGKAEPKPEAKTEEKKEEPPQYVPQIPDQIFAALEHEDPAVRRQGINAMIGGAMNKVYSDLSKRMVAEIQQAIQQVPTIIQSTEQQKAQQADMRKTFYEEHPNFGTSDKRRGLVAMVAIQVATELGEGYKGFTPEFREALATRIEEMTGIPKGKAQVKEPIKTKEAKPAAQTFQAGTGARPDNAGQKTLQDEIADTIGMTLN